MNEDKLYSFIMRGELTKVSLNSTDIVSRHSSSDALAQEYIRSLSLDLLDEEYVNSAKVMATVYTAIAAFENTVMILVNLGQRSYNLRTTFPKYTDSILELFGQRTLSQRDKLAS